MGLELVEGQASQTAWQQQRPDRSWSIYIHWTVWLVLGSSWTSDNVASVGWVSKRWPVGRSSTRISHDALRCVWGWGRGWGHDSAALWNTSTFKMTGHRPLPVCSVSRLDSRENKSEGSHLAETKTKLVLERKRKKTWSSIAERQAVVTWHTNVIITGLTNKTLDMEVIALLGQVWTGILDFPEWSEIRHKIFAL